MTEWCRNGEFHILKLLIARSKASSPLRRVVAGTVRMACHVILAREQGAFVVLVAAVVMVIRAEGSPALI